ncbi:hypothetical protein [Cobetia marina]|uniref:hypothetical protein n=1 Tax=Cobetia marina TaxID=28258 RepID=UPI00384CB4D4
MTDATSLPDTSPVDGTQHQDDDRQLKRRHTINQCLIPLLNQYAETKSHFTIVECRDALLTHSSLKSLDKHTLYRAITKRLMQCIDKGLAIEVGIRGKKRKLFQMLSALQMPVAPGLEPVHSTTITEKEAATHDTPIEAPQAPTLPFTEEDQRELEKMIAQNLATRQEIGYMIEYLDLSLHQKPQWRDVILAARKNAEDMAMKAWGHYMALIQLRAVTMPEGEA